MGKVGREHRRCRHVPAAHQRQQQESHPAERGLDGPAGAPRFHPEAHQHGDRDGTEDGEDAPGTVLERIHHHQGEHGKQDDHDRQHGDHREDAGDRPSLLLGHPAERLAIPAQRAEQDHEVLHRARKHDTEDDPDRAGQVAKLGGQHRADQRSRASDRREMVAEEDPARGRHEVPAIGQTLRRRGAAVIQLEDAVGEEAAVETEGDEVGADGGKHQPGRADGLPAVQGEHPPTGRAHQGDERPRQS